MGVSFETCLRRGGDVMMGRRYDVLIRRRRDAPLRCLGDVPSRSRWVFHLRRTCNVTGTYRETLPRRLNAGWDVILTIKEFYQQIIALISINIQMLN